VTNVAAPTPAPTPAEPVVVNIAAAADKTGDKHLVLTRTKTGLEGSFIEEPVDKGKKKSIKVKRTKAGLEGSLAEAN